VDIRFWKLVRVGGILCAALVAFAAQSSAGNVCDLRTASTCDPTFTGGGTSALFFTDEQHPALASSIRLSESSRTGGSKATTRARGRWKPACR